MMDEKMRELMHCRNNNENTGTVWKDWTVATEKDEVKVRRTFMYRSYVLEKTDMEEINNDGDPDIMKGEVRAPMNKMKRGKGVGEGR